MIGRIGFRFSVALATSLLPVPVSLAGGRQMIEADVRQAVEQWSIPVFPDPSVGINFLDFDAASRTAYFEMPDGEIVSVARTTNLDFIITQGEQSVFVELTNPLVRTTRVDDSDVATGEDVDFSVAYYDADVEGMVDIDAHVFLPGSREAMPSMDAVFSTTDDSGGIGELAVIGPVRTAKEWRGLVDPSGAPQLASVRLLQARFASYSGWLLGSWLFGRVHASATEPSKP